MRRVILIAGLAMAVGAFLAGSALPAVGGSNLPFKGSLSGTSTHNLATGQVHIVSAGRLSHFGLTTVEQDVQLVPTSPSTFVWSGTGTLTAANGDQMVGTTAGQCTRPSPTSVACEVVFTSSGGTGRFADASATFTITFNSARVALDPGPPPISYGEHNATLAGSLSW